MTEPDPPTTEMPPTEPQAPRRLHRSRSDRIIGGVAGGLGRHFDVDPIVFRITLAALAFAGGIGFVIYLAVLLFVPAEGSEEAPLDGSNLLVVIGAGLLAITALIVVGSSGFIFGPLFALAVIAGIGYAGYRLLRRSGQPGKVTAGQVIGWLALGMGALLALGALAAGSAWAAAEGSGAVVAGIVILIGALLAASALRGQGARWLVLPALAIAGPLGLISAADVDFDGGIGERIHRPATVADIPRDGYRLGAGHLEVDLRNLDLPRDQETVLDVSIGLGAIEVLVPRGTCILTDTRVGGGFVEVANRTSGGFDVDYEVRGSATDAPRLLVRGDVGLGGLEISDTRNGDFGHGWEERHGSGPAPITRPDPCDTLETASAG